MKRIFLWVLLSAVVAPQRASAAEIGRDVDAATEEQAAATFQKAGMAPEEARSRARTLDRSERAQLARHGIGPKGGHLNDHDLLLIIIIILLIAILL